MSPMWNDDLGSLSVNGTPILRLDKPADNQRAILNAFQQQGWPARIANPLPPDPEKDERQRLGDTVYHLNGGKKRIPLIRFRRDGRGQGVIWEFVKKKLKPKKKR